MISTSNTQINKLLKTIINHNIAAIKGKSKGQRDANTKITPSRVIKEETEELSEKPLYRPPSGKMIHWRIKLGYMNSN